MTKLKTNDTNLLKQINDQSHQIEQRRVLRQMVAALIQHFSIVREEGSLVFLLANGRGRNNAEANEQWILQKYPNGIDGSLFEQIRRQLDEALWEIYNPA